MRNNFSSPAGSKAIQDLLLPYVKPMIGALEAWRGPAVYNREILEQTGDKVLSFHGFDCCNKASQITHLVLQRHGFKNFKIVSDATTGKRHYFLCETGNTDHPILIDPTFRQFFSFPGTDSTLNKIQEESNTKVVRDLYDYIERNERNVEDVIAFQKHLMSEAVNPIFIGTKAELESRTQELHRKWESANKFGPILSEEILRLTMLAWEGDYKTWKVQTPSLEKDLHSFKSDPDSFTPMSKRFLKEMSIIAESLPPSNSPETESIISLQHKSPEVRSR